ncbi:helix-turn-helix transcriptional regulator [Streptomyces sp. OUCMDZ-4982]|uniref:telomere-associated protein Tap n=1 Tax=Streptomyces sp. OUCMDZ-4982 TaxID=2973090 RepID=UPI00215B8949|nr:helix-turn-helix transcriptional regulator [Streptomyces sp. OUCMDZ-4982]MCR8945048.1 helix-turn-helix transcriptional regulator [Streptomyces sp. OUCMDZ-4982]
MASKRKKTGRAAQMVAASQEELFAAVDDLLGEEPLLPPPDERARLREAAGVTQARLAEVLRSTVQTVKNWENGRSAPRPPRLEAYQRLLEGWAAKYPDPRAAASPEAAAAPDVQEEAPAPVPAVGSPAAEVTQEAAPDAVPAPAPGTAAAVLARRAAARTAVRTAARTGAVPDPRYAAGPLLVLDGDGTAYGVDGLVLECPARTIPQLVAWTLEQPVGAPALNKNGRPADPLVVLTEQAAVKLGLPARLEGHEQRAGLRLEDDHPAVKQITRAKWKLTRRGFGPWARVYRPAKAGTRQCVQFAIPSWGALDPRAWPGVTDMEAPEIARVLGLYADRVTTPRGSTAVTGLELMTALRPPTRAVRDDSGAWVSDHNPGSLGTDPVDCAPPEAPPEHPLAQGWKHGFIDEEVFQWVRDVDLLDGCEVTLPYALGLDVNAAFLAASSRINVGLCAPVHVVRPTFDKKVPGSWLADLSHIELDPRLPSPFTPSGQRPTGPAWYETHTLAYAQELGHNVHPLEAFIRPESGAYLDPWHDRLKAALLATMADLGVTAGMDGPAFLAAMERLPAQDPALRAVLAAVKATAKGGIGQLRKRATGLNYTPGERYPALERPTWRPDIRAAIISKARVNMHRKMLKMASVGLFPLAVLSDCVVYPAPTRNPLDLLPYTTSGKPLPGAFRLGVAPGLVKLEGVQTMDWAVDLMDQGVNVARIIKGDGHDAALDAGE